MKTEQKLIKLRNLMRRDDIQAFIINSSDPHGSETPASNWELRSWMSGFDGSSGTLIVSLEAAALWTDFRYFTQAEKQLQGTKITLQRTGLAETPSQATWLSEKLNPRDNVGIDGRTCSCKDFTKLYLQLQASKIRLHADKILIDELWAPERPAPLETPIFEHKLEYTGLSTAQKLAQVRQRMQEQNIDWYPITALDSIAWLLNIRADDIKYTPVAVSYLLLGLERCTWFINSFRLPKDLEKKLNLANIDMISYDDFHVACSKLPARSRVLVPEGIIDIYTSLQLSEQVQKRNGRDIITDQKSVKNDTEIKWLKHSAVLDALSLIKFYTWFFNSSPSVQESELDISIRLSEFRLASELCTANSFANIVAYQENSALPHYKPIRGQTKLIDRRNGMLLIDSGGQYLSGTTDITRTWTLGVASPEQKLDYTLVLKGHIALLTSRFPVGTYGYQLDTLARMALWQQGSDYKHGTGHGVGYYLNVHEGPMNISYHPTMETIKPGALLSNEPGIYHNGRYGIRIENLILCKTDPNYDNFLCFESVTLFPYDRNLIDLRLLSASEITWINDYHQKCLRDLEGLLPDEASKTWLRERCAVLA